MGAIFLVKGGKMRFIKVFFHKIDTAMFMANGVFGTGSFLILIFLNEADIVKECRNQPKKDISSGKRVPF